MSKVHKNNTSEEGLEKQTFTLQELSLKKAAHILRAINHPFRQSVIKMLHEHGRLTVTELYLKLHLEQSVVSQHLSILRKAGFVMPHRDGKFIFYSVNLERLKGIHLFSAQLLHQTL